MRFFRAFLVVFSKSLKTGKQGRVWLRAIFFSKPLKAEKEGKQPKERRSYNIYIKKI